MVFSSQSFLFLFLPLALALGVAARRTPAFSPVILLLSLVFFYWSSGLYALILVFVVGWNYAGALVLARRRHRALLALFLVGNLVLLGFFKYAWFAYDTVDLFHATRVEEFLFGVALPIGISFYTFQGVSYLVDVWRGEVAAERNLMRYGAYQSFFPQLVAGPIVRYRDVAEDFRDGRLTQDLFAAGAARFLFGLAKKVLIADSVAIAADAAFALPAGELNFAAAWLGAVAYSIQIYFDFSGYSDMAIGLAMMFGVRLKENFDHPYAASTLTEFWRRWHISLSTWFRDYLYIPLGGNRAGTARTYANLLIVFLLTGLWHGAQWTFVLWGLWHGAFLMLERLVLRHRAAERPRQALRLLYFFPVVVWGWVLFRSPDLPAFGAYSRSMLSPFAEGALRLPDAMVLAVTPMSGAAVLFGAGALLLQDRIPPLGPFLAAPFQGDRGQLARAGVTALAAVACGLVVLSQSFSPFLYFRF